jgi:hypothetical protein
MTSGHKKRRTARFGLNRHLAKLLETKNFCFGGRTRARTWDPLIKSQLLYQLSYAPGKDPETATARGRRLAKRPLDVQQACGLFAGNRHPGK